MPVTHESFCSPRPSASASPYTVYTNTLNGITFVDGVDPDENRVLITYPTPEQLPREVIDRRLSMDS
jgi:hypothetical protein